MKRVSVIILNYNGAHFIRKLLDSLAKQTFHDFETIFIDNASTDDSLNVLEDALKQFPPKRLDIKVIVNEENIGYCMGNNIGVKHAEGDYVIFLNNDTFVSRTWLEELVKAMELDPWIGACQSQIISMRTDREQKSIKFIDAYSFSMRARANLRSKILVDALYYPSGTSMIVRRDLLLTLGGFDEHLFFGDYDLGWRMRLLGYKIAINLDSICYHYGSYTLDSLYSHFERVYHSYYDRIHTIFKNYSLPKTIKELFTSIIIMFILSVLLSFKYNFPYFVALFNAIFANLKDRNEIIEERTKIQRSRVVSDKVFKKYRMPNINLIDSFRK